MELSPRPFSLTPAASPDFARHCHLLLANMRLRVFIYFLNGSVNNSGITEHAYTESSRTCVCTVHWTLWCSYRVNFRGRKHEMRGQCDDKEHGVELALPVPQSALVLVLQNRAVGFWLTSCCLFFLWLPHDTPSLVLWQTASSLTGTPQESSSCLVL